MRDWTEKHIRELVRQHGGKGGGDLESALLLRSWVYNMPTQTLPLLNGGRIEFHIVKPSADTSILMLGMTLVRLDFYDCKTSGDYFLLDPLATLSGRLTPNTVAGSGEFWTAVIANMVYGNVFKPQYYMSPATYQVDKIYCDEQPTDATVTFSSKYAWFDEKRNWRSYDDVVGRVSFEGVPDGTSRISVLYLV